MNDKIKSFKRTKKTASYMFLSAAIILFTLLTSCNNINFNDDNPFEIMDSKRFSQYNDYKPFKVVNIKHSTPPTMKLAAQACAGLYNREKGGSVYTHTTNKDSQWLDELDLEPEETLDASTFVEYCIEDFPKTIKYSYNNQQKLLPNILTVGAVLDAVPLDENMGVMIDNIVFDATLEFRNHNTPLLATKYVYEKYVNKTTGLAMLNPGYCVHDDCKVWDPAIIEDMKPFLVDFVYSKKLFTLFLVNGCNPIAKENKLLNRITSQNPWKKPIGVYGYNNSWMVAGGYVYEAQTKCVASHNMGAIPTEVTNLSFFSTRRKAITNKNELKRNDLEKIDYDPNKTFIAFVIGDGDNIAFMMDARKNWLRQRLSDCQKDNNSCAPITWTMSPHLNHLAPDVLNWYYEMSYKTGKDYFMLPPSGYFYAYPSSLTNDMQEKYVSYTEEAANILGTRSTVSWEWFYDWKKSERSFLPKYAKRGGVIKGIFPVNVPYMFPTFTWKRKQFHKILTGRDGNNVVLFVPRSWRGVDNRGNFITKKFYLSPDKMAQELANYPRGTVAYVYMTSDGGLNLENSFMKMVKLLPGHVKLVSTDTASRLALEAHHNTWGNPVSFRSVHGKYLVAENDGGGAVNATRKYIGAWEKFRLISTGELRDGAKISIQTGNGNYFSAHPDGALDANRRAIGAWETFTLINHSSPGGLLAHGHTISLKSIHNRYVVAEDNGRANANRSNISAYEKFKVLFDDQLGSIAVNPSSDGSSLRKDQGLAVGMQLSSRDKRFNLSMQSDGNLVLYQNGRPLWSSGTNNREIVVGAIMQSDGNFVIYGKSGRPLWASNTAGNPGAWVTVQDDGNMVIYSSSNRALWSSNTCCR